MRLLIIIPNIVSYRSFLTEVCDALIADGSEIHIACSDAGPWDRGGPNQVCTGIHFHRIDAARGMHPLQHFRAARQLRAIVRAVRPNLIHAHFSAAIFTTALGRSPDWPFTIATFHGVSFPARRGLGGTIMRIAETFSARRFDEVCVLTSCDARALRKVAPALRVRTLTSSGLGCDLVEFTPPNLAERESSRQALGFKPDDFVFVFLGRFVAFKGFDCAVRAFLSLAATLPNARLLLIGARDPIHSSGLSHAEERALRDCSHVVDAGFQNDVRRYLSAADAMVFPSVREGMPVCLMEALAMGIPVITRDTRGCREVVRDDIDGFVLRQCDTAHIRDAMHRLATEPALHERLAHAAHAGRDRFSRAHFIAAQMAMYAECRASLGDRAAVPQKAKVAHVTTVASSLHGLLLNQIQSLSAAGYEVCGISSPGHEVEALTAAGIAHIAIPISRNLAPFKDLASLFALWRLMRRRAFTIVHTHTPKAGLLGQLAARLAGVPIVVNTVHGFYFHEHMHPLARRFYIFCEKIAARCSDAILSQNAEDAQTAVREHICPPGKIRHLGNGIDLAQFTRERVPPEAIAARRREFALPPGVPVVGFVGRLAGRRKGFLDFMNAARAVANVHPTVRFLIVGSADLGKPDAVEPSIADSYGIADRCIFAGQRANSELPVFYSLMSLLVLPSLFEGVPRVVMEAAAMSLPSIVSDVKGNREAVLHESTGLLFPLADVPALTAAILRLLGDPDTLARMGSAGRRLAESRFDERAVFARIHAEYEALLHHSPAPTTAPLPA